MKPGDPQLPHGGVTGLILIPGSTKGTGKWVLRYTSPVTGKRRNMGLGTYPAVGVAAAGRDGQAQRDKIAAGIDPLEPVAVEDAGHPTFGVAAQTLHTELLPGWKNAKHGQQWINTLTTYALPVLGDLRLPDITPGLVADVLRPIWLDKPETAGRLKQRIHAVMAWGWAHGYIAANPVDVVDYLLPQQPGKAARVQHQPAMPWRDVPAFVAHHLRGQNIYDVTRPLLEFLILTATRSGEARGARWDEIDLVKAIWTIPAERMKAAQPHQVPLSGRAIEILRSQIGRDITLVFPSPLKGGELSDMVLTSFLRRVKAQSDTSGRTATAHGFRSSFRDWCSANRYDRDLAEISLAHAVSNKVEGAYNRERLLELRRPLMQAWAEFVGGNNGTRGIA